MANLRANNVCGTSGRNAIDGSVFFDGTADQLNLATSTDWALGTGAYTAEFWVKAGRNTGESGIFGTFTSSAYGIGIWHNGATLYFEERQDGFSGTNPRVTYTTFDWSNWNYLAMSRDSTSGTMRAFVNGLEVGTVTSNLRDITATTETTVGFNDAAANNFIGNITNFRLSNTQLYTGSFDPPTEKLAAGASTILLCCQDRFDLTQEATGKTITEGGDPVGSTYTPSVGVDEGVVFGGDPKFNTQGVMYFPTGDTSQRGRGRGLFGGGVNGAPTATANIAYINIQSQGNTTKFGDLTATNRVWISGFGSSTRAIWPGGTTYDGSNPTNIIDFVTIATTSNATDFGDLTSATTNMGACSSQIRGVIGGGYISPANINTIDYVTIASAGNAADFGDITVARRGIASMGSSTRGVFAGGMGSPALVNVMDFVTIATTGNAADFGDMTQASRNDCGGCSSGTRGIIAGGKTSPANINTIQFITIASTGNASDFGDLQETMATPSSLSNSIRGVFSGSYSPDSNTINFVNIATTGNASDFGDNTLSTSGAGGTSDSHGGLS